MPYIDGVWFPDEEKPKGIPFTATLSFTPNQLKELICKTIREEYGYDCDAVAFNCTLDYGQMDRGPGTPVLSEVKCTVRNGTLIKKRTSGGTHG